MDARLAPLVAQLDLNARLLLNCVADLDESQMTRHPVAELNSPAFLVAHLIDTRHHLLGLLERSTENPVAPYVSTARSMAEVRQLPPTNALIRAWNAVTALAHKSLSDATDEMLAKQAQRLPGTDGTVLGAIAFLLQHESYHIGQLAFIRRMYGLPAMRYT